MINRRKIERGPHHADSFFYCRHGDPSFFFCLFLIGLADLFLRITFYEREDSL